MSDRKLKVSLLTFFFENEAEMWSYSNCNNKRRRVINCDGSSDETVPILSHKVTSDKLKQIQRREEKRSYLPKAKPTRVDPHQPRDCSGQGTFSRHHLPPVNTYPLYLSPLSARSHSAAALSILLLSYLPTVSNKILNLFPLFTPLINTPDTDILLRRTGHHHISPTAAQLLAHASPFKTQILGCKQP